MRRAMVTLAVALAMLASVSGTAGGVPAPDSEPGGLDDAHGVEPGPLVLDPPISAAAPDVACRHTAQHPFVDALTSWATIDISCIHDLGVAAGVAADRYGPGQPVTREQMAAFLARLHRLLTGEACTGHGLAFFDSVASFAADDIACLTAMQIANGVSSDRFDPGGLVTREQMAAFLARLYRQATGELCTGLANPFVDAAASFASDAIGCLLDRGIAAGTSTTSFDPAAPVTREQMAAFLARVVRTLPDPVMRFIYFVESDQTYDPAAGASIEDLATRLQLVWIDEFDGTFRLRSPVVEVMNGDHPAAWYRDTPHATEAPDYWRLGNMSDEVHDKLGLAPIPRRTRFVVYPAAVLQTPVAANYGGAFMDGDDAICAGGVTIPFVDPGTPADCLALLAHEVGHLYDLDHTGPEEDCMQLGAYTDTGGSGMCEFFLDNVNELTFKPPQRGLAPRRTRRRSLTRLAPWRRSLATTVGPPSSPPPRWSTGRACSTTCATSTGGCSPPPGPTGGPR